MAPRLTQTFARHPWWVLVVSAALVLLAAIVAAPAMTVLSNGGFRDPGSESAGLLAIVFIALLTSGFTHVKTLALGTAFAVFLDATLVRGLLVPAFMRLTGRFNWWAPPWLRRLHHRFGLGHDGIRADGRATPAGLAAATRIRTQPPDTRVVLVNATPFNTYRPWLQYALPGLLDGRDLRISLPDMAKTHRFTFLRGVVDTLDAGSGTVHVNGDPIQYRRVILAGGAPTDRTAITGADQYAIFPCDVDGFEQFQRRLAATSAGTVSIVLTGERISPGLEDAAWLARTYHTRHAPEIQVRLIADGDCFTEQFGTRATRRICERLESWGAEVALGTSVRSIGADHVAMADGRTAPSTITAVVGPLRGPELKTSGLTDPHGFFPVEPSLASTAEPTLFVAGDAIRGLPGLRKNWQLSVRQANLAADNALRSLAGERLVALNTGRDRRRAAFSLPDVGGTAFLVWNQRLLSTGGAARRLRIGFDRQHFTSYLPEDTRWRRLPG